MLAVKCTINGGCLVVEFVGWLVCLVPSMTSPAVCVWGTESGSPLLMVRLLLRPFISQPRKDHKRTCETSGAALSQ
jgi:hypothetical protein